MPDASAVVEAVDKPVSETVAPDPFVPREPLILKVGITFVMNPLFPTAEIPVPAPESVTMTFEIVTRIWGVTELEAMGNATAARAPFAITFRLAP